MPNIRTYENKVDAPRADNSGAQAAAQEGRASQAAFDSVGQSIGGAISKYGNEYQERQDASETAQLAANITTAHSELGVAWDKIASSTDPNEIDKAQEDFLQNVAQPRLDQIGSDLHSEDAKNLFTKASAGIGADLFNKTSSDVSSLKGVATVSNMLTVSKQVSNAVFSDPTSFNSSMMLSHMAVDASVKAHGMSVDKAIELNKQFDEGYARSAALGMIQRNPTQAKADISDGRFDKYLDAKDIDQLQSHADEMVRMEQAQQRSAEVEQRRQQTVQFDQQTNKLTAKLVGPDGQLTIPSTFFKDAANLGSLPGAEPSTVRAMIDMARSVTNDLEKGTPVLTDPHTYEDFRNRAFLPESDPRVLTTAQVLQARADHKLNDKDYSFWNAAVNDLAKDENKSAQQKDFGRFLTSYKGYITNSNFLKVDAYGDQRYYEWSSRAQQMHDQLIASGKTEADARTAITSTLPQYQTTKGQNLDAIRQRAGAGLQPLAPVGAAKRMPGENAAAFLKRTGG